MAGKIAAFCRRSCKGVSSAGSSWLREEPLRWEQQPGLIQEQEQPHADPSQLPPPHRLQDWSTQMCPQPLLWVQQEGARSSLSREQNFPGAFAISMGTDTSRAGCPGDTRCFWRLCLKHSSIFKIIRSFTQA